MSNRPGSSAGRPGTGQRTAAQVPAGTATRLMTGAAPGTARPGTRSGAPGGGVALNSQVQVTDRPVTQQGLGGPKTAGTRGSQRMVQDRTYFFGVLRNKINELTSEIGNMKNETDAITNDRASYVSYEKRAESLTLEIKDLQSEVADYNTLVDMINTDATVQDIQKEILEYKNQNSRETALLDNLFEQKQQKENQIRHLEIELKQERGLADSLISEMPEDMRGKYMKAKHKNEDLMKDLNKGQEEIDKMNIKKNELLEELSMSAVKQEAVKLYEQLRESENKRDQLMLELQSTLTPQQEREQLLKQVKDDNAEIAVMERQVKDMQEKYNNLQEEIQEHEKNLEMNQGERNQQYKELKKKEESMDEFLKSFENNKQNEQERIHMLEISIVENLENISRNISSSTKLPTVQEFSTMKEDLQFKEQELKKSENTANELVGESAAMQKQLLEMESLEVKLASEIDTLKQKMDKWKNEMDTYSDMERLRRECEEKKQKLSEQRIILLERKEGMKRMVQELNSQHKEIQAQLSSNETHNQLTNLEKKLQYMEQNNYAIKEHILMKLSECDYHEMSKKVGSIVSEYNTLLINQLSGRQ